MKTTSIVLVLSFLPVIAHGEPPAPRAGSKQPPALPLIVEKVVVSATVAEEGRDPASVTTLDRGQIALRNRGQDMAMLLAETPSAYAYSDAGNGVGYAYLSLRGFDQRRIAVYINGVPLNDPESQQVYFIDLADLAGELSSVQVQRGTGTALYGSPSVGGVVNLESGALETSRSGSLTLGGGSFGTWRGSFHYTLALQGGRSSLSVRAAQVRSDGYRRPAWTRHSLGEFAYQRLGGDSVLRVRLFGGPERTQLAYLGVPLANLNGEITGNMEADRRVNPLAPGEIDHFVQPQLQVLHDLRLHEGLLLKNTLYGILGDGYFRQHDGASTYSPQGFLPPTASYPTLELADSWRRRSVFKQQYGWLPSIDWSHRGGRLVAGLELRISGTHHLGQVREGARCGGLHEDGHCQAPFDPITSPLTLYDYETGKRSFSAYFRESLRAGRALTLSLELQATHHDFRMRQDRVRGFSFDAGYTFVTPRLGLNWKSGPRLKVYGSWSTARSEPRFEDVWNPEDPFQDPSSLFSRFDRGARFLSSAKARPERLMAYETGAIWRSSRAMLKMSAYWMDFRDELVFAGGINQDGLPVTDNAARSVHKGIEVETASRLPWALELNGQLAASRDRLHDYVLRFGPRPQDQADYSGNRIALFPSHQARLRLTRSLGPARLSLGLRRVGTIFLDNTENDRLDPSARRAEGFVDKKIDPFTLADARLDLDLARLLHTHRAFTLLANLDNLAGKRYSASGYVYDQPYFIPGATRNIYVGLRCGF